MFSKSGPRHQKVSRQKVSYIRLNGHLHEVIQSFDEKGRETHTRTNLLHVEFTLKDLMQVIMGASLLAVPVGFTEEAWRLGTYLPLINVFSLMVLSIGFVSFFVYYASYKEHMQHFTRDYILRVGSTYLFALLVVGTVLTLIEVAPWGLDPIVALKRIIIVAFPATMSAAISDRLK